MKFISIIVLMTIFLATSTKSFAACVTKEAVTCADGSLAPQDPDTCEWLACPRSKVNSGIESLKQAVHSHNAGRICPQNKMLSQCADGSMQAQDPDTCQMIPCPGEKICPQNKMLSLCADGSMQAQDPKTCKMIPCSTEKICPQNKMLSLCADGSMQAQDPKTCKMIPCGKNKNTDALYGAMNDAGLIKCEGKVCSASMANLKCQSPAPAGSTITKCTYEDSSGDTQTIRGAKANKIFSEAKKAGTINVNCTKGSCSSEGTTVYCTQRGAKSTAGSFQECSATRTKDLEDMSQIPDDRNVDPGSNNTVR